MASQTSWHLYPITRQHLRLEVSLEVVGILEFKSESWRMSLAERKMQLARMGGIKHNDVISGLLKKPDLVLFTIFGTQKMQPGWTSEKM